LTWILPLHSVRQGFLNLLLKNFTQQHVVPIVIRQGLLRSFWRHAAGLLQFLLADELIDQIFFDPLVPRSMRLF